MSTTLMKLFHEVTSTYGVQSLHRQKPRGTGMLKIKKINCDV